MNLNRMLAARLGAVIIGTTITAAIIFVDGFPPVSWQAWLGLTSHKPVAAMTPMRHIPGQVTVTMPKPRGNDSSMSPVPVPLILVSTQLGRNNREGFAHLGVDATSPQTYAAGALLANGARLSEIYSTYIVLERDGQSVRLYVQGAGAKGITPALASLTTVGGTPPTPILLAVADKALTNYLRPSPVFEGDALTGFQVYPGKDEPTFAALGLKPGDVIVSMDGVAVSSADTTLAQLDTLLHGSALRAEVRRDGHLHTVSLDGSVLGGAAQ
jgi:hypothetical protein